MSSGRGDGRLSSTGASDPSVKGKIVVEGSSPGVDQLSQGVGVFSSDAGQDEGTEVYSRKSKNKSGKSGRKQRVLLNSPSKAWGNADTVKKLGTQSNAGSQNGRGNNQHMKSTQLKRPGGRANQKPKSLIRGYDNDNAAPTPAVGPPRRNGWDWYTRAVSAQSSNGLGRKNNVESVNPENVEDVKVDDEDNQQLVQYKNKFANAQKHSKALEEAYHRTLEENRIVRQRSKMLYEQMKEEIDDLEQCLKEELKIIYDAREEKKESFEKIQQEERETLKQSQGSSSSIKDHRQRVDEIEKFIQGQDQEMEEFVAGREKLIELPAQRMVELKRRLWEEQVALEKELNAELAELMKKYPPKHPELVTSNNIASSA